MGFGEMVNRTKTIHYLPHDEFADYRGKNAISPFRSYHTYTSSFAKADKFLPSLYIII